jgi:hypothetical protein
MRKARKTSTVGAWMQPSVARRKIAMNPEQDRAAPVAVGDRADEDLQHALTAR